jgi:hypothetical protein
MFERPEGGDLRGSAEGKVGMQGTKPDGVEKLVHSEDVRGSRVQRDGEDNDEGKELGGEVKNSDRHKEDG